MAGEGKVEYKKRMKKLEIDLQRSMDAIHDDLNMEFYSMILEKISIRISQDLSDIESDNCDGDMDIAIHDVTSFNNLILQALKESNDNF